MRRRKRWLAVAGLFVFLLVGCQAELANTLPKEGEQMDQAEEKKAIEIAVQHIKKTYNKEFEVTDVDHTQVMESRYLIRGIVKDGKDTQATVYWTLPENTIKDSYVLNFWDNELEPKIKSLSEKLLDVRNINRISYTNGTKENKYTGEVPSVFEVLDNGGDKDYSFHWTGDVYEQNGQHETAIRAFLKQIQEMNFNRVVITVYVYDDPLKSASKNVDEDNYLLYGYTISSDDIQKANIDSLDLSQYKTAYE